MIKTIRQRLRDGLASFHTTDEVVEALTILDDVLELGMDGGDMLHAIVTCLRRSKRHHWYVCNKDSIKRRRRAYYRSHREQEIAYASQYAAEHPEQARAYQDAFKERNPDYWTNYQKEWRNAPDR